MSKQKRVFLVTHRFRQPIEPTQLYSHVVVTALNREFAKSKAQRFLGGDPDQYVVSPLTKPGDRVHFDITL